MQKLDTTEERNKRPKSSVNVAFSRLRNSQVYQQAILLALINKHFQVKLLIPIKRSVLTLQLFKIEELTEGNDCIRVEDFVEKRCQEKFSNDVKQGIAEKTAKRRYETNRTTEQLHLLMDVLREFGYKFESRYTSGKKGAQKVETFNTIYLNDVVVVSQQQIVDLGTNINEKIAGLLFDKRQSEVPKNCDEIASAMCFTECSSEMDA
ncbi:hypothetical protein EIN_229980 [Entamoeba invadens IP1]|uniref:Uncharacterized protein n=1 Tax=Entamoeba invadens IP1 TaxID=370355 RepID=A0A0A1U6E7_ENTIV|nr:hypothetical protein EIN_229980 [Entamoeba invadens IP1]ELP88455.1 hypothetical protein EIN_229980 [Entamoeba invadens IP1]|eukprot:XP_004255226.1 hypothetical protein EIN_229980 [Entamoeba invadens IP1]